MLPSLLLLMMPMVMMMMKMTLGDVVRQHFVAVVPRRLENGGRRGPTSLRLARRRTRRPVAPDLTVTENVVDSKRASRDRNRKWLRSR